MRREPKETRKEAEAASRSMLLDIEPELHLLRGVVALLHGLAESADSIEPVALAALAHFGEDALTKVEAAWQAAYDGAAS